MILKYIDENGFTKKCHTLEGYPIEEIKKYKLKKNTINGKILPKKERKFYKWRVTKKDIRNS